MKGPRHSAALEDAMKMWGILLAAVLICGCSARPPELLLVDALTEGTSRPGTVYYVAPTKEQEKDLEFRTFKRALEARMREAGLRTSEDFWQADAALFVLYTFQKTSEQIEVQEPVYGTTGSTSQSVPYLNRATGQTVIHTTTRRTRGITGYRARDRMVDVYKATLALSAVSRSTGKELWRTVVAYVPDDPDRRRTLDTLLQVAGRYFNKETPGFIRLELERSDEGLRLKEIRD